VLSAEIRERFLRFFEERGHLRLPSASLIPHDDPSLLFTVAGMVPLKPYISGAKTPPSARLVSSQKCFRGAGLKYDDIASVGDSFHHTFFEMLGNWSIGDYFKETAIEYAWELVTQEFKLDPARVWVSVYPDDAVAESVWAEKIGVPRERISKLTDNWWEAGPTGPSGYDSELYWDWGPPCSCGRPECTPQDECGGDRWSEFWNLVFMEFDQKEDGSRALLPKPTVDTGMGLERMTSILQGKRSNYETDLFAPLVAFFRARAAAADTSEGMRALNVLADHLRAACFLIADGVLPGNEGRGYVLRRVIRRAVMHARRIQLRGGLAEGVGEVVAIMGPIYPELVEHRDLIEQQLRAEEAAFARTLEAGAERFEALVSAGAGRIAGDDAFRLYDTFGLPIELIIEMAAERGVAVDVDGFRAAMEEQRERSRAAAQRTGFGAVTSVPATRFVGYETLTAEGNVLALAGGASDTVLSSGESGVVYLDVTPFYAEAGGQIGDAGHLEWRDGRATVSDTTYLPGTEARAHHVRVDSGELRPGMTVTAIVEAERRGQTARHHSSTHLLNRALREVLGSGVVQRGSYVGPEHTTFDFSFSRALTAAEISEIERRVNAAIRSNYERTATVMPIAEARATGAVSLIDEKYGDNVRVIDFGGWSRELCGGTHVGRSGDIGAAIIVSESSIGQGIRRIDMVAGEAAEHYWQEDVAALHAASRALRARPVEVPERVAALQDQVRKLNRELEQARRGAQSGAGTAAATVEDVAGIPFAHLLLSEDEEGDGVSAAADSIFADRLKGNGVAMVLSETALVIKVGGGALRAGIDASELIGLAREKTGGRGGGRKERAQGAVKDASQREAAVASIREAISQRAGTS
jgi:alanyl-tRNA synthetase